MAMCVSASGGVKMTRSFLVSIDHPEGTVNVAPADVTRGVWAVTRSIAGLVSAACGEAARLVAAKMVRASEATRAAQYRAVRKMDISVPHQAKDEGLADPRYTQQSQLVKRRGKLGLRPQGLRSSCATSLGIQ